MTVQWHDLAVVGVIARAHGCRGEVVVNPETDFPERRFRVGAELFAGRQGVVRLVRVATMRLQRGRPILGLEGVDTRNDALALAGCELRVPERDLEPLPRGSFYRHDLVGCDVETRMGVRVGAVRRVDGAGGSGWLVVDGGSGEVLIPLAAEICVSFDLDARKIVVNPPDGLLELNAARRAGGPGAA